MSQDFLIKKEKLSFDALWGLHSGNVDVTPTFSRYNRLNGNLTGISVASITVNKPAITNYFNEQGYWLSVERNRIGNPANRFLPFANDEKQKMFADKVFDTLYTVAKQDFPQLSGTVFFLDEDLPVIHVFINPTSNNPLDLARKLHKSNGQDNNEESDEEQPKSSESENERQAQQVVRQGTKQQIAVEQEEEEKKKERQKRERERERRRRREIEPEP